MFNLFEDHQFILYLIDNNRNGRTESTQRPSCLTPRLTPRLASWVTSRLTSRLTS
jgi:hypothetical protein